MTDQELRDEFIKYYAELKDSSPKRVEFLLQKQEESIDVMGDKILTAFKLFKKGYELNQTLHTELEKVKTERDQYYDKMTIANVRYTQEREKNKEAVEVIEKAKFSSGFFIDDHNSKDTYLSASEFLAKYRGEK